MDYEKLHKDTIAKLQEMVNSGKITVKTACGICADFVPESEDERIRNFLIKQANSVLDSITDDDEEVTAWKSALAWLEKQGNLMKALQISNAKIGELVEKNYYLKEQLEKQGKNNMGISEATKQKLEDNLNKALEKETAESWNKFLDEQGEQKMKTPEESLGVDSDTYNKIVDECVYGEQKPIKEHDACEFCEDRYGCVNPCSMKLIEEEKFTNKVEPKFKVGDIVKDPYGDIYHIIEINNDSYKTDDGCFILFKNEDAYRLWTIQDAKDGDILCGYPKTDYPWIGIFHNLNTEGTFNSYCFLQAGQHGKFCPPSEENIFGKRNIDNHISEDIVPATKEQRNLLFQKMKESGYEWDAEKKELKKIEEKKDIHNKLTAFEFSLKHIIEEAIECGDIHNLKADADLLLKIAQKTSWSEEDIELLDNTIKFIEDRVTATSPSLRTYIPTLTGKEIPFLKALKDRVQLKQEWSEEDNRMCKAIIDNIQAICEEGYFVGNIDSDELIKWLNSLKDKVQPQQEWSEEDERIYKSILYSFAHNYPLTVQQQEFVKSLRPQINVTDEELAQAKKDAYNDVLDKIEYDSENPTFDDGWSAAIWYLKKRNAQPQSQWKPSDEQMDALHYVTNFDYGGHKATLVSLYEQLKKLKG